MHFDRTGTLNTHGRNFGSRTRTIVYTRNIVYVMSRGKIGRRLKSTLALNDVLVRVCRTSSVRFVLIFEPTFNNCNWWYDANAVFIDCYTLYSLTSRVIIHDFLNYYSDCYFLYFKIYIFKHVLITMWIFLTGGRIKNYIKTSITVDFSLISFRRSEN